MSFHQQNRQLGTVDYGCQRLWPKTSLTDLPSQAKHTTAYWHRLVARHFWGVNYFGLGNIDAMSGIAFYCTLVCVTYRIQEQLMQFFAALRDGRTFRMKSKLACFDPGHSAMDDGDGRHVRRNLKRVWDSMIVNEELGSNHCKSVAVSVLKLVLCDWCRKFPRYLFIYFVFASYLLRICFVSASFLLAPGRTTICQLSAGAGLILSLGNILYSRKTFLSWQPCDQV